MLTYRMVLCAVYGCKKDSKCHHDVSYYRLSALTRRYCLVEYELRKQRRAGYLATLQQKDVGEEAIKISEYALDTSSTTDQQGFMT